jgi:Ribbon-helix-helix protein, copG family.
MATISIRLNDNDNEMIKKYAAMNKMTISELVRQTINEKIEDEFDLMAYERAIEEYRKNPVSYSHAEVVKMMEELND